MEGERDLFDETDVEAVNLALLVYFGIFVNLRTDRIRLNPIIMKTFLFLCLLLAMSLTYIPAVAQTGQQATKDTASLGLPGDGLDLYAVMDLFQKSKTIEDFQKSLNEEKTGINNLDLNLDGKVDFIKVVTKQNGDDFTFILQDDVSKTETQDVAVILVSKDKNKKVTMQIVGDKALYGKDYIVEPKTATTPGVTPNPAYTGDNPVKETVPATTTTVIVEQTPIVQYVYSPAYVPYAPPYYYGFYPPYFFAFSCMAVSIYRHNNYYYHGGYGYHGNTTVIHNTNNYNNYNNNRQSSSTVDRNNREGNYNRNNASTRPSGGSSGRGQSNPSVSDRKATGGSSGRGQSNPSVSDRKAGAGAGSGRQSNPSVSNRQSGAGSGSRQSSPSMSNRQSSPSSSFSGGGRSGGGRSGGGYSGGGRAGGGGRGGRR